MRTPEFGKAEGRTADPSAPVGMTNLFGIANESFQDELSSRPERSGAEGSAGHPSGFPNSEVSSRLFFRWTEVQLPLLKQGAPTKLGVEESAFGYLQLDCDCLHFCVLLQAILTQFASYS